MDRINIIETSGLNIMRGIIRQEHDQLERDLFRRNVPLKEPYWVEGCNTRDQYSLEKQARNFAAKKLKNGVLNYIKLFKSSRQQNQSPAEIVYDLLESFDTPRQGYLMWSDFITILNDTYSLKLAETEIDLLRRHFHIEAHGKISYKKFVNHVFRSTKKAGSKNTHEQTMSQLEAHYAGCDKEADRRRKREEILEKAQDDRAIRFLKLVFHCACVHAVQKKKKVEDILWTTFYSVPTTQDERLSCSPFFTAFEACLDVRIDDREKEPVFLRLTHIGEDDQTISFDELYRAFRHYEIYDANALSKNTTLASSQSLPTLQSQTSKQTSILTTKDIIPTGSSSEILRKTRAQVGTRKDQDRPRQRRSSHTKYR